jgi:ABC-type Fe3+ transport system permease subunit
MAAALLFIAFCLLLLAVLLLVYILVSKRTANIQAVWRFAVEGHRPSQWYMGIIVLAFSFAVVSVIYSRLASNSGTAKVSSASEQQQQQQQPIEYG